MTVAELIKQLEKMPPNKKVFVYAKHGGTEEAYSAVRYVDGVIIS